MVTRGVEMEFSLEGIGLFSHCIFSCMRVFGFCGCGSSFPLDSLSFWHCGQP